jgi:hypothetical protein
MANRKKEIESLRAQILKLEQLEEREEQEKRALAETQQQVLDILTEAGLTLEAFIRHNERAVRRIIAKMDKEQSATPQVAKKSVKRKATAKTRKKSKKARTSIKIPAGTYSHVPGAEDAVFEVKEKGPRPKILKSYAEEVGLEKFFEQCRVD